MAKLYLKFEQAVLKEFTLTQGVITIGRLPDNLIQVDNLAVSGHHAKIYWDNDHYVLEDNNSLNGTYVNSHRVSKAVLSDGDQVMVGKHTIVFKDSWHEEAAPAEKTQAAIPALPKMEATVVLDTKKAREMLAAAQAGKNSGEHAKPASGAPATPTSGPYAAAPGPVAAEPPKPARDRVGHITVMAGKTDQTSYALTGKLSVVGKSDMATIKLKGWFAPKVAAVINRRDNKYFIAASEKDIKVKVNEAIISGQQELQDGDMVEVAGVKMTFSLGE